MIEEWDSYFMAIAKEVAKKSKDRSTKVGCVVVGPDNEILTTGYNGFPRGIDDNVEERHQRPLKYAWTEHAERNAIYNAARTGTRLKGSRIYLPWFPCMDCARAIVQSGIVEVVCYEPDPQQDERWQESFDNSKRLFDEAEIQVRFLKK